MSDPVVDGLLRAVEGLTAAITALVAERRAPPPVPDPLKYVRVLAELDDREPAPPVRRCGWCGEEDHDSGLCPKLAGSAGAPLSKGWMGPAPTVTNVCALCGETGHSAGRCPTYLGGAASLGEKPGATPPAMPTRGAYRPKEPEPEGERRALFEKFYNDGATFPVIAQALDISETVAWRWVDKLGLPRRGASIKTKEVDEAAFKERWAAGDSYEELGAAFSVSKSKVWDLKKKLELPDRPQNRGFGKAGQPERRVRPRVDIEVNTPTEPIIPPVPKPPMPEKPRGFRPDPLMPPPAKLFPLKPAPEESSDFNDLGAPVRRLELPITVPASRRPLAKIDTESNDVEEDTALDKGVQRRCACNRVFTAHSLKEVVCPSCRIV